MTGRTIVEKIWAQHAVPRDGDLPDLLYIDLHFLHEVSSPQAFDGLRLTGHPVRRPELTLATEDHNVPTDTTVLAEPTSRLQVEALRRLGAGPSSWLDADVGLLPPAARAA